MIQKFRPFEPEELVHLLPKSTTRAICRIFIGDERNRTIFGNDVGVVDA
jgi:hypothetical protein